MNTCDLNQELIKVLLEEANVPLLHLKNELGQRFWAQVPIPNSIDKLQLIFHFGKDTITVFDSLACHDLLELDLNDPSCSQKIKNLYEQVLTEVS